MKYQFMIAACVLALALVGISLTSQELTEPRPKAAQALVKIPECKCQDCKCGQKEAFIGSIALWGRPFGVTDRTEAFYDGKTAAYNDIPDEGTELVEVSLDLKRNLVIKIYYRTRKDA